MHLISETKNTCPRGKTHREKFLLTTVISFSAKAEYTANRRSDHDFFVRANDAD
jgi:hypothetical protein